MQAPSLQSPGTQHYILSEFTDDINMTSVFYHSIPVLTTGMKAYIETWAPTLIKWEHVKILYYRRALWVISKISKCWHNPQLYDACHYRFHATFSMLCVKRWLWFTGFAMKTLVSYAENTSSMRVRKHICSLHLSPLNIWTLHLWGKEQLDRCHYSLYFIARVYFCIAVVHGAIE